MIVLSILWRKTGLGFLGVENLKKIPFYIYFGCGNGTRHTNINGQIEERSNYKSIIVYKFFEEVSILFYIMMIIICISEFTVFNSSTTLRIKWNTKVQL